MIVALKSHWPVPPHGHIASGAIRVEELAAWDMFAWFVPSVAEFKSDVRSTMNGDQSSAEHLEQPVYFVGESYEWPEFYCLTLESARSEALEHLKSFRVYSSDPVGKLDAIDIRVPVSPLHEELWIEGHLASVNGEVTEAHREWERSIINPGE